MTKKEKQHVKAILIDIRDNHIGITSDFICPCLDDLVLDKSLVLEFLNKNRPTSRNKFKSFTKHKYWLWGNRVDYSTSNAWWGVLDAQANDEKQAVIEEKKKYLTALIETLN